MVFRKSKNEDMLENHPQIRIADVPNFYDTSIFNECEQMNYVMETLDIWADIHPYPIGRCPLVFLFVVNQLNIVDGVMAYKLICQEMQSDQCNI